MKRTVMLALALAIAALAVAGCATASGSSPLGAQDDGMTIELSVGDEFTVRLPSNVTTGFSWTAASLGPLEQVGEPVYEAPDEKNVVGAGGTETFTFKAKTAGEGTLRLEYRQPWDKGAEADDTWSVVVTVD